MSITPYRFMTDDELSQFCSDRRQQSPIIEELCQRLESCTGDMVDLGSNPEDKESEFIYHCKACEAEFKVDVAISGDLIELKFS